MKKEMYYAGIGSRKTPQSVCDLFTKIAILLKESGYILRSGGAAMADESFEKGAGSKSEIFRPQHATIECMNIAQSLIPWWDNCEEYAKKLHARNVKQVLGKNLDEPAIFVLCWTPGGKEIGGTRTAIVLAKQHNIPVFNFYNESDTLAKFIKFIEDN